MISNKEATKNKDERMRKSDCFMTQMNYEWRTFGETNPPQTIGVLILLFHIKKKFVILYMYCQAIPYIADASKEDFGMENKITLPIGMSNFTEIRKNHYYYIDKTELLPKSKEFLKDSPL